MDRRTAVAVLLSLLLFWSWTSARQAQEVAEQHVLAQAALAEAAKPAVQPTASAPHPLVATPNYAEQKLALAGCSTDGVVSTVGPAVRGLHHSKYPAPFNVQPVWSWLFGLVSGNVVPFEPYGAEPGPVELLSDNAFGLTTGVGPYEPMGFGTADAPAGGVALSGLSATGVRVDWKLAPVAGDICLFTLTTRFTNEGATPFAGPVWVGVHDEVKAAAGALSGYVPVRRPVGHVDGDVVLGDGASVVEEAVEHEGVVRWFGLADTYFGTLLLPQAEGLVGALHFDAMAGETPFAGARWVAPVNLAPGASAETSFQVYAGPLETSTLEAVDASLPELVQFGWFAVFAYPLKLALVWLHAAVGNWGIAIALLTFGMKLVLYPLTQSAFKSGQAMAALQPRLAALKETYKDDPNQINTKTMELFKESGVSPMGGCLPMLIQMPIWIALYNVLRNVVELYHTDFLYLRDLSSLDPFGVLPTLVVALMWFQQQLTPMTNMDPAQQQVMKYMPLIVGIFFYGLPSGLMVYIFVNTALSILQQWYIKRQFQAPVPVAT